MPLNYYNTPIQLIALLIGIIYFFPGFHKVWSSGLYWAFSDNLKNQIFLKALEAGKLKPDFYTPGFDFILQIAALLTIAFELSFVFLIVSKKHRGIAVAAGVIFHVCSYFFLQINFLYLLACYVIFLDWEKIFARFGINFSLPDISAPATFNRSLAVILIGAILIGLNVTAGIFKINSWPVSCFPTFEYVAKSETDELKYVLKNKKELDKNILRNKFSGTTIRQWEYRLLNERMKNDSTGFETDAANLLQRIEKNYSEIKPDDTIEMYLQHLAILKNSWQPTNTDTLIFSSAVKR